MQILQFSTKSASSMAAGSRTTAIDGKCSGKAIDFEDLKANNTGGSRISYGVRDKPGVLMFTELAMPSLKCPPLFQYYGAVTKYE